MKKILLVVLGTLVGLAVGSVLNMGLIRLNMSLHGPEGGLDMKDQEAFKAFLASMPALGFLIALLAHSSQAFLGSLVGTLIAGRRTLIVAWIIGGLTLLGCVYGVLAFPSPIWFSVLDLLLPLPAAFFAARLVMRKAD